MGVQNGAASEFQRTTELLVFEEGSRVGQVREEVGWVVGVWGRVDCGGGLAGFKLCWLVVVTLSDDLVARKSAGFVL